MAQVLKQHRQKVKLVKTKIDQIEELILGFYWYFQSSMSQTNYYVLFSNAPFIQKEILNYQITASSERGDRMHCITQTIQVEPCSSNALNSSPRANYWWSSLGVGYYIDSSFFTDFGIMTIWRMANQPPCVQSLDFNLHTITVSSKYSSHINHKQEEQILAVLSTHDEKAIPLTTDIPLQLFITVIVIYKQHSINIKQSRNGKLPRLNRTESFIET